MRAEFARLGVIELCCFYRAGLFSWGEGGYDYLWCACCNRAIRHINEKRFTGCIEKLLIYARNVELLLE